MADKEMLWPTRKCYGRPTGARSSAGPRRPEHGGRLVDHELSWTRLRIAAATTGFGIDADVKRSSIGVNKAQVL